MVLFTDLQSQNGGHCQPLLYLKSIPVAQFELGTFDYLNTLIASHAIPCDWKVVGGVHPIKTRALLIAVKERLQRIATRDPALAAKVQILESHEELKQLRVEGAMGAIYQPNAAKCWPYKLVAWILERLVRDDARAATGEKLFNLQTSTSALGLQRLEDGYWIVHTSRGQITTKQVLLATNAYTSYLLPRMTGLIVPVRGQVSALVTPDKGEQLQHSYAWLDNEGGEDYLIHRDNGPLILGGERLVADGAEVGVSRDDAVDAAVAESLRRALYGTLKLKEPDQEEDDELAADFEWTGIMGYSKDDSPWVGAVPESLGGGGGLWISAGYTGHGMPVAARTGISVAQMMMGREKQEGAVAVPEEYKISETRIRNLEGKAERTLVEELKMLDRP
jgi:glycine/D-amino acid oxidase-like deaminating enzyme